MSAHVETEGGMPDRLKWFTASALLIAALGGFYYYAEHSLLLRVVVLLAVAGAAVAIASRTATGRVIWGFIRESRTEVRKVVWPNRKETVQTTGVIIALVAVVAVIMWIIDGLLSWAIRAVLGQGG